MHILLKHAICGFFFLMCIVAVTASNDELSEVGACFLQLKLILDKGGGKRESKLMGIVPTPFFVLFELTVFQTLLRADPSTVLSIFATNATSQSPGEVTVCFINIV